MLNCVQTIRGRTSVVGSRLSAAKDEGVGGRSGVGKEVGGRQLEVGN